MTGPERGDSVTVDLRGHGEWLARTERTGDDRIAVALHERLPVVPSSLVGTPATLRFATPRGLVRADAAVVGAERGGVLALTLLAEPEVDQRREHVRVAAPLAGTIAPVGGGRAPLHTFTIDVSGAGVLVAGAGPVAVGDAVAVALKVPGGEPLEAHARVVRVHDGGHVAVAFEHLDRRQRERLVRFVFDRQRLERREARGPS